MDREGLPAFATDTADLATARWERWLNRFTNFAVAKNITDARRLKAALLHYVGENVLDLSESLVIVSDTPFEETKRLLTAYFAPQRNVEYEVFVFRQAEQHTDETLAKFNARLRQLAKNCNFHETDREVRSQIIQKCLLNKVREKGLSDTDIMLSNLLKYGAYIRSDVDPVSGNGRQ